MLGIHLHISQSNCVALNMKDCKLKKKGDPGNSRWVRSFGAASCPILQPHITALLNNGILVPIMAVSRGLSALSARPLALHLTI